ncbi:sensor histidine kinase [Sporosarcina sp. NPDC096371]|uniref:cache domain-containing sensor histidine kinase n=1 Tax=Sporosarcina sp. NPDC096371 TaxID=3364530 RepID=UPI003811466E
MIYILERIKKSGLFVKIFIVMVISIITISVTITFSTLRMSENLFMKTFSITNAKVIDQINTSVESFNHSIANAANNISKNRTIMTFLTENDADSLSMSRSYYNMATQMSPIHSKLDAYDVGITILGINGRYYSTNRPYWEISEQALPNHPITLKTNDDPKRLQYHFDQPKTERGTKPQSTIIATKALIDGDTESVYGTIYFTMREPSFRQFFTNYTSEGNDVVVVNRNGIIVSSNRTEMIGQQATELLNHALDMDKHNLNYKQIDFNNSEKMVLTKHFPLLDMYLINLIDRKYVRDNIINTKAIIVISISIVSVALLFVYIISRGLTKSLTRLVKEISSMSKYDFEHYVTVSGSYETNLLATEFNHMIDELHEYVDALMITQKKQRNAELSALQQQINPHFLYNTLASIKIIVQQGNREKASEMIHALISLLQNALGNVSETITVEEELKNMENYVFINNARYGERIRVNYYISPNCLTYQLPKLIIQPFIENAFFHGFNQKSSGFIYIMIGQEGETLICEVIDNGDGMEMNPKQQLPNYKSKRQLFSGIGINNVNERIKLLYGETYGVEISSQLDKGTKVRVRLPITNTNKIQ